MLNKRQIGWLGEDIATEYLKQNDYKICHQNYQTRYGEIDIIAEDKDEVCVIVEVKTYKGGQVDPRLIITPTKLRRLKNLANAYRGEYNLEDVQFRFDLIIVKHGKIDEHIENIC